MPFPEHLILPLRLLQPIRLFKPPRPRSIQSINHLPINTKIKSLTIQQVCRPIQRLLTLLAGFLVLDEERDLQEIISIALNELRVRELSIAWDLLAACHLEQEWCSLQVDAGSFIVESERDCSLIVFITCPFSGFEGYRVA